MCVQNIKLKLSHPPRTQTPSSCNSSLQLYLNSEKYLSTMKLSLLAVALTALATHGAASYIGSCRNCRLEGRSAAWLSGDDEAPVLLCDCARSNNAGWRATRLDLNNCIMNNNGYLGALEGGGLEGSCNMFSLRDGKYFSANCRKS
ncbi:hypothetical protein B0T18DRAFT_402234 [Schizothecium vesticola]|uniref:Cyanovirin-N domain-containing protein n=1 Tax=Schizothecium vesticola TaxID=314040 RepID=A0AA40F5F3_9PEZI|nr:hypothetical protein B0T18DRAFT_402234 [Schizothecium vesticola]